jgi:hypothetical protein
VKRKQYISAKIKYTKESIDAKVIRDYLPRPKELAFLLHAANLLQQDDYDQQGKAYLVARGTQQIRLKK